jgi:hypothetical protein
MGRGRWWALTLLVASRWAHAEEVGGFVRFAGGVDVPVASERWTEAVRTSPVVSAMLGAVSGRHAGGISADWTIARVTGGAMIFPLAAEDESLHRVRLLAHGMRAVSAHGRIEVYVRAGAGLDLAFARYNLLIGAAPRTRTKAGLGLEAAVGVWFAPGPGPPARRRAQRAVLLSHDR